MKKKYVILIIALLGWLLFTAQKCATTKKTETTTTSEEETNEEELDLAAGEEEDESIGEIGGADFNLIDAWDNFDEKDYSTSAQLLSLAADYLEGESEDLLGKDADHVLLTIEKIDVLINGLESENVNHTLLKKSFPEIGLNLVKDYLAIAVAINESPEDNEYYVTKAIALLERIVPTLSEKEKISINDFLNSLSAFDKKVDEGTLTKADNLQDFVDEIQKILSQQKIIF